MGNQDLVVGNGDLLSTRNAPRHLVIMTGVVILIRTAGMVLHTRLLMSHYGTKSQALK